MFTEFLWSGYERNERKYVDKPTIKSNNSLVDNLLKDTKTTTESEAAENSSWDQANSGKKLGLVWRNRKKISQIINDYLYLPFFLLIILCFKCTIPFVEQPKVRPHISKGSRKK
jgi:hypothetical protein